MTDETTKKDETLSDEVQARQAIMRTLALSPADKVKSLWDSWPQKPDYEWLRKPETGQIMLRGRIGGGGAPFNVGEATLTRCVIQLASGTTGHAQLLGRDSDHAGIAACIDALWQEDDTRNAVENHFIAPLAAALKDHDTQIAAESAATKVEFFTMVRGED